MLIRTLHGSGVIALLGCLAWLLAGHTTPVLQSAGGLLGERWYTLVLDDRHVGYLHSDTRRDPLGRWRFDSDLRFVLSAGNPVRIRETLLFAAAPPFELLLARQQSERPGQHDGTLIRIDRREGAGYRAQRLAGGRSQADAAEQPLSLRFTLDDYLGSETWLRETQPSAGSTIASRDLDFSRRRVVGRQFRVRELNPTGYALENPAPFDPTRIQLDERMRPVSMTLSGLFELRQVSRKIALAPRTALQAASYFVALDRPLRDHTAIRALAVEVQGGASAVELWPELARGNVLHRQAGSVTVDAMVGDELADTADYPVSDPRLRTLARTAVAGAANADAQVAALTRFVHQYLRYDEDVRPRHVLTLLDQPAGDCTEYADLLTTLARSLGMPARTVFGLAYADQHPPAFRFHAWNEVRVDGRWRAVDPTWNQLRVDATHIPLPQNVARSVQLLTGGLELSFVVRDVEYF